MRNIHSTRDKIAVVVAVPEQVRYFLVNHIINFSYTYNVTIVSNLCHNSSLLNILPKDIQKYNVPILREISLFSDIKSLLLLMRYFHRKRFKVVYSVSPKAGLLSMVAAWFIGVPVRIHTFTGQVWVDKKGVMKLLLKLMDRITVVLATVVVVDSSSQRDFLIKNHIVSEGKSLVLGNGSISGVDVERFHPKPMIRRMVREAMGATEKTIVFLYVGRLKKDKGVFELARAFIKIMKKNDKIALWFVGPDEDDIQDKIKSLICECNNLIRFIPYTTAPEDYMVSSDILCLASYREGFGSTIIEAAACGIPAIGSRIYGITDAIIDGETGVLIEKGSVSALASAMQDLSNDSSRRERLGKSAKNRTLEKFHQQVITDELMFLVKQELDQV